MDQNFVVVGQVEERKKREKKELREQKNRKRHDRRAKKRLAKKEALNLSSADNSCQTEAKQPPDVNPDDQSTEQPDEQSAQTSEPCQTTVCHPLVGDDIPPDVKQTSKTDKKKEKKTSETNTCTTVKSPC